MKALILAAGYGKRLRPITDTMPKAMVKVNGNPLLFSTLNNLTEIGIKEIGIVVGHMADYIKTHIGNCWNGANISYYENARYFETNNVVSLYEASSFFDDDTLMLECDIYYEKTILKQLINAEGDCNILVSPFNEETMDGTIIHVNGDRALELILGKWQAEGFDYANMKKTVNMYYFTQEFAQKYMSLIGWYVKNMSENSYYEKVLGSLMYLRESDIRAVEIPENTWCEIDDADDLERASKMKNL